MKRRICGVVWECVEPGHWTSPFLPDNVHLWWMMRGTTAQQWEVWAMRGDEFVVLLSAAMDMEIAIRDLFLNSVTVLAKLKIAESEEG